MHMFVRETFAPARSGHETTIAPLSCFEGPHPPTLSISRYLVFTDVVIFISQSRCFPTRLPLLTFDPLVLTASWPDSDRVRVHTLVLVVWLPLSVRAS